MRISVIGYPSVFHSNHNDALYNSHELSDQIIVNHRVFNQLLQEFDNESVLFMNLINKTTQVSYLVTLGSPHNNDENIVFIPEWIMDYIGCSYMSEPEFYLEKATMDLPVANKIQIKIIDMEIFNADMDICGYFERALMNLHSIQEGLSLPIYMEELDETILAYIEKVEPSICSRIVKGDVEVEFISTTTEESLSTLSSLSPPSSSSSSSSPLSTIQVPPNTPLLPSFSASPDTAPFSLSSHTDQKYDTQDTFYERQQKIRESWMKRFSS